VICGGFLFCQRSSTLYTSPFIKFQVNGQNVVGIKDKEIAKIIDEGGQVVTVTVIPTFIYKHMMAK
jgi:hypothetical protein